MNLRAIKPNRNLSIFHRKKYQKTFAIYSIMLVFIMFYNWYTQRVSFWINITLIIRQLRIILASLSMVMSIYTQRVSFWINITLIIRQLRIILTLFSKVISIKEYFKNDRLISLNKGTESKLSKNQVRRLSIYIENRIYMKVEEIVSYILIRDCAKINCLLSTYC